MPTAVGVQVGLEHLCKRACSQAGCARRHAVPQKLGCYRKAWGVVATAPTTPSNVLVEGSARALVRSFVAVFHDKDCDIVLRNRAVN